MIGIKDTDNSSVAIVIFYIPETAFKRSAIFNIDTSSLTHLEELANKEAESALHLEVKGGETREAALELPLKRSFLRGLLPFHGTFTDEKFLVLAIAPLRLLLNPAVLWVGSSGSPRMISF